MAKTKRPYTIVDQREVSEEALFIYNGFLDQCGPMLAHLREIMRQHGYVLAIDTMADGQYEFNVLYGPII